MLYIMKFDHQEMIYIINFCHATKKEDELCSSIMYIIHQHTVTANIDKRRLVKRLLRITVTGLECSFQS